MDLDETVRFPVQSVEISDERKEFCIQPVDNREKKKGTPFFLKGFQITIGRERSSDVVIADEGVSRLHAVLSHNDNDWNITDAQSKNGVWVNELRLLPFVPLQLRHGDIVSLGDPREGKFCYLFTTQDQASNCSPDDSTEPKQKLKKTSIKSQILAKQLSETKDLVEEELTCSICSELFIQAYTLGCSHTFCKYCIDQWKKRKNECPICRTKIETMTRGLVLDNVIEQLNNKLSPSTKQRRATIYKKRQILGAQAQYSNVGSAASGSISNIQVQVRPTQTARPSAEHRTAVPIVRPQISRSRSTTSNSSEVRGPTTTVPPPNSRSRSSMTNFATSSDVRLPTRNRLLAQPDP